MIIIATQLRVGMNIIHKEKLCRVASVTHVTPGKGHGMIQAKLREVATGTGFDYRFRSDERIERATLEQRQMEFLYADGEEYVFMNSETYEQINLNTELLGDSINYLLPNIQIKVEFFQDQPIGVDLPQSVELEVVETAPELKGATASASAKPATLETGLVVQVPQFVKVGEKIRVDTSEGKYIERVK